MNYSYDSGSDRLLSYNGEAFEYDEIGNPTIYRGKSATWAYGRQLQSFDGNTYTYDARGRRLSKQHGTDDPIHFTYDSNGRLIQQSNGLEFIYDHTGVMGVIYNGSTYFYRKNAQNDIIALLDKDGNVVVKYTYDAWGNNTVTVLDASATTIANLNPFRYRSYYYDTETNLYFLKTRYYDPEVARFMTIDGITYLNPDAVNGLNLYAYCGNNPVMRLDPNGTEWWNPLTWDWATIADVAITAVSVVVGVAAGAVVGITTFATTMNPLLSIASAVVVGAVVTGVINNAVNAIYYNRISDGISNIDETGDVSHYVNNGYINRWERLDYTKSVVKEEKYSMNSWLYYSEYNAHMYAWLLTGWACGKDYGKLSDWAKQSQKADIEVGQIDNRPMIKYLVKLIGHLGL